jgi:hypothetical protein
LLLTVPVEGSGRMDLFRSTRVLAYVGFSATPGEPGFAARG